MTDSIEIVEEVDGVQMDLLAEALGKGNVAEPGAAAEYTEVGAGLSDPQQLRSTTVSSIVLGDFCCVM